MSIAAAKKAFQKIRDDSAFRARVSNCREADQAVSLLASEGLIFTIDEWETIYYNELMACQTEEAAMTVKEIRMWWLMVVI